jgi:cytochrome P450
VDGLAVPDGGAVSISPYLAHRDPRFWPEPDTFRPARWLLPSSDPEVQLRHPYAYIPFLAGPRSCLGQRFAMQEAAVVLAFLLSRFALEPAPDAGPVVAANIVSMEPLGLRLRCAPLRAPTATVAA